MQKAKFIEKNCRISLPKHFAESNVIIEETEVSFIVRKVKIEPLLPDDLREGLEQSLQQASKGQLSEFDAEKELKEFEELQDN